jgi:hypothetical protein
MLSCGTCQLGACVSNTCVCTPVCVGKVCGDSNACGASCGSGSGCRGVAVDFGGAFGWVEGGTLSPNPATGAASCPAGYSQIAVRDTINEDYAVVFCLRVHTPNSQPIYDFGGMWSYVEGVLEPNPFTGAGSCPAGYTAQYVNGTLNLDWPLDVCYKPHSAGTTPDHLFGGAWGYVNGGTLVPNPATQAASCPPDYVATQISGTANTDWPVFFCR